jgi:hypothetical protein
MIHFKKFPGIHGIVIFMIPLGEIERIEMKHVGKLDGQNLYLGLIKSHTPYCECALYIEGDTYRIPSQVRIRLRKSLYSLENGADVYTAIFTNPGQCGSPLKSFVSETAAGKRANKKDILLHEATQNQRESFMASASWFKKNKNKFLAFRPLSEEEKKNLPKIY